MMTQGVCWVLDADIRKFFDSVNHEWLLADDGSPDCRSKSTAVGSHVARGGRLESGKWQKGEEGTPQGAGLTPLTQKVISAV